MLSKRQKTRRAILGAAQQLFLAQGYDATTPEQIAATADVSRATFFNHFPGKLAALQALAADLDQRLVQLIQHYGAKPGCRAERIRGLFSYSARVAAQTRDLTHLLFSEALRNGWNFDAMQMAFKALLQGDPAAPADGATLETQAQMLCLAFVAGSMNWFESRPEDAMRRAEFILRAIAL